MQLHDQILYIILHINRFLTTFFFCYTFYKQFNLIETFVRDFFFYTKPIRIIGTGWFINIKLETVWLYAKTNYAPTN